MRLDLPFGSFLRGDSAALVLVGDAGAPELPFHWVMISFANFYHRLWRRRISWKCGRLTAAQTALLGRRLG